MKPKIHYQLVSKDGLTSDPKPLKQVVPYITQAFCRMKNEKIEIQPFPDMGTPFTYENRFYKLKEIMEVYIYEEE